MIEKKLIKSIIAMGVAFVLLLAGYVTVSVMFTSDSTEAGSTTAEPPELKSWEGLGYNNMILMSPRTERTGIKSIEVHNEHGVFTFARGVNSVGESTFLLEGHENMEYDEMYFAQLVVTTGIPTTNGRVNTEATAEDLASYGLDKPIARWTITTTKDETYKIAVGNKLLDSSGYYAHREEYPEVVYILNTTIEQCVLTPVEDIISPVVCSGITTENYSYVDDFKLSYNGQRVIEVEQRDKSEFYNPDALIENQLTYPVRYKANDLYLHNGIALLDKYSIEGTESMTWEEEGEPPKAVCLNPTAEQLREYGLNSYYYTLSFNVPATEGSSLKLKYNIRVSELQKDGYYYVTSNHYDHKLIIRCPKQMFSWIEIKSYNDGDIDFDILKWIDESPLQIAITRVDTIMFDYLGDNITYDLTHGTDVNGNSTLSVTADNGFSMDNNDTYIFKRYYAVMIKIKLATSGNLTEEQIEEIVNNDSKYMATIRITLLDGTVEEFKFYRETNRRALLTANGEGEFYVLTDWLEKLYSDTNRLLQGIEIDSDAMN